MRKSSPTHTILALLLMAGASAVPVSAQGSAPAYTSGAIKVMGSAKDGTWSLELLSNLQAAQIKLIDPTGKKSSQWLGPHDTISLQNGVNYTTTLAGFKKDTPSPVLFRLKNSNGAETINLAMTIVDSNNSLNPIYNASIGAINAATFSGPETTAYDQKYANNFYANFGKMPTMVGLQRVFDLNGLALGELDLGNHALSEVSPFWSMDKKEYEQDLQDPAVLAFLECVSTEIKDKEIPNGIALLHGKSTRFKLITNGVATGSISVVRSLPSTGTTEVIGTIDAQHNSLIVAPDDYWLIPSTSTNMILDAYLTSSDNTGKTTNKYSVSFKIAKNSIQKSFSCAYRTGLDFNSLNGFVPASKLNANTGVLSSFELNLVDNPNQ